MWTCGGRSPRADPSALADVEFDGVAFAQVLQALAVHGALMEKVLLLGIVLNEAETLVDS
jgi:hypothetical protein